MFELEKIWNGCRYLEALFLLWKFRIFVAIWSWFQANNLFGLEMRAFWKKMTKKLVFGDQEKGPLFSHFQYFAKMPVFVRLLWPHQLTYNNLQGISRKTMSISFIWYQLFWIGASDEAYVTSWKSGLNFNALDLLISVLSNKAVLGIVYLEFLIQPLQAL